MYTNKKSFISRIIYGNCADWEQVAVNELLEEVEQCGRLYHAAGNLAHGQVAEKLHLQVQYFKLYRYLLGKAERIQSVVTQLLE